MADGKIVGTIMYSAARIEGAEGSSNEVLCFGPLCVDPVMQNMGIGGLLLNTTMQLAREEGYPGIVILGNRAIILNLVFKLVIIMGLPPRKVKILMHLWELSWCPEACAACREGFLKRRYLRA